MDNNSACAYDGPGPNFHPWNENSACANPCALANLHIATYRGMRRDMGIIPNDTLMVYGSTCVHDTVLANLSISLDNSTLHHNRSATNPRCHINKSTRMNGDAKLHVSKSLDHFFSDRISTYTHNDRVLPLPLVRHLITEKLGNGFVVVNNGFHRATLGLENA